MTRLSSEWFLLRRDRTAALAYVVFALACALAAADSVHAFWRQEALLHGLQADEAARLATLDAALAAPSAAPPPAWDDPANPGAMGRGKAATYALLPLSDIDVLRCRPAVEVAVSVSTEGGALDRAIGALAQPHVESLGRFNLGFLLVVVLPLFVLLLSFDLLARDHESGVSRLLLAHEAQPRRRYLLRTALRGLPLAALAWLAVLAAVVGAGRFGVRALAPLGVVLVLLVLSVAFWSALSLAIQARLRTATASGIVGLAAWAVFVILGPTLLAVASEAAVPIPSRIERTSTSREASRRASLEVAGLLSRFLEDHPELAGGQAKPDDYYVRRVATDATVAAARAPVEARFFLALEQRRQLVARMASLSPVSLVALTLDELAGASDGRIDRFRHEVDAFQRRFAAFFNQKTMRGERLARTDLAQRPRFMFTEQPLALWPLLAFAVWTAAMIALAVQQLPRALALDDPPRRREHALDETSPVAARS